MKNILNSHIKVPFTASFGSIGTEYTNVLISDNGAIKSIGEYIYRIDRNEVHCSDSVKVQFAKACEQYRLGKGKFPSLCYFESDSLTVNFF